MSNQYYIVDLAATREHKELRLWRWGQGTTDVLADAARMPQATVNADLDLYDNGNERLAILCEAVDPLCHNGTTLAVPYNELLWLCKQDRDAPDYEPQEQCA